MCQLELSSNIFLWYMKWGYICIFDMIKIGQQDRELEVSMLLIIFVPPVARWSGRHDQLHGSMILPTQIPPASPELGAKRAGIYSSPWRGPLIPVIGLAPDPIMPMCAVCQASGCWSPALIGVPYLGKIYGVSGDQGQKYGIVK